MAMRRLTENIDIGATPDAVWGVLNDFGGVAQWAPFLRSASLVGDLEHGVGSYRVMRHYWGFRLEESVVEWKDHEGYAFEVLIVPFPIGEVRESWSLKGGNPHVTVTSTVSYGMRLGPVGAFLDWVLVRHLIRREMRAGLKGLRAYVESRQST
jgi:hypothetical protein